MKIEAHTPTEGQEQPTAEQTPDGEKRVRQFFEEHRSFFTAYAADGSMQIKSTSEAPPLPDGKKLATFAIDLERGVLYGEPRFFTERGFSDEKALFAFLHEFEHFRELRGLLAEKGGDKVWERHINRLEKSRHLKLMDNVWDDVRMNRSVVSRAPVMRDTKSELYRENLFPKSDMRKLPRHLQFAYTLLRERMLPGEPCTIDPEVRAEVDRLSRVRSKAGIPLLDYASRPDIPSSVRIKLQERYLEPVYERFFKEDVEKKKEEQRQGNKGDKGEQGDPGDQKEKDQQSQGGEGESPQEEQEGEKSESQKRKPKKGKPQDGKPEAGEPSNPEEYFRDDYDAFDENNPDHVLPREAIEKAVKEFVATQKKKGKEKTQEELLEEAYAREAGVKIEDLRTYQRFWKEVEDITNPETDESVIEELRGIFRRIITERLTPKLRPKLPTTEGEILAKPAEAVASIKAGITEPAVWETLEVRETKQKLFGEFDVAVVADRSGSMEQRDEDGSVKYVEQRKAVALILEALTEFSQELDDVRRDLDQDLHVRNEAWGFGDDAQIGILKPLSETLTEKERVAVHKALGTVPGESTKDYKALEKLKDSIPAEDWQKIEEKKLKKIIIVLSDGVSSDASATQRVVAEMREKGIVVVGVGITKAANSIKTTYAPDGRICKKAGQLGVTLGELLKEFLEDL